MHQSGRADLIALATALARTAAEAARHILDVKKEGANAESKKDFSPVTEADRRAEEHILADLERLEPGIPVVAEERCAAGVIPDVAATFFLVDPLDGTREFLAGRPEYTVNIALIENGRPVMGVLGVPETGVLYLAADSWAVRTSESSLDTHTPVRTREPGSPMIALASLSHADAQTDAFLKNFPGVQTLRAGSSLKFARVAEGVADVYPRFGPTCEWDTAAGHALLSAAGGVVLTPEGEPFVYGKSANRFLNGSFIAWGRMPARQTTAPTAP